MPLRKSSLDRKWYFKWGKFFYLLLPVSVFLFLFFKGNLIICNISPANISTLLRENYTFFILGYIAYFLILEVIWRLFLYIVFGRVINDTKGSQATQSASQTTRITITEWILTGIVLVILVIFVLSQMGVITLPRIDLDFVNNSHVTPSPELGCQVPAGLCVDGNGMEMIGFAWPQRCGCPEGYPMDPDFLDVVTPGGPYVMCFCGAK